MGITKDNRPRDWAYMAVFHPDDLPALQEMVKHIRETHDVEMIERFNSNCERVLDGNKGDIGTSIPVPNQVVKTADLMLNPGLDHCIKIILGTSTARWSHFGMGVSGSGLAVTNTALASETITHRVALAWAEPVGMRIFFGAISSHTEGFAPLNLVEMGVYNGSASGAVLLNRSVFYSGKLPGQEIALFGDVRTAPFVLSAVVELCPVA